MAQQNEMIFGCDHQYLYRDPSCNCTRMYCDRRRKRKCKRLGCKHWIAKSKDWKPRNEAEVAEEKELRSHAKQFKEDNELL